MNTTQKPGPWYNLNLKIRKKAKIAEAAPDLLEALQSILGIEVKGHSLLDRLQFSDAGRALSKKCLNAIAKTEVRP